MKLCQSLLASTLFCGLIPQLQAQVTVTETFNVNLAIPDGSSSGLADQRTIATSGQITDVNVTLNISGTGFGAANGDFYAYLTHDTGLSVLLNRVGVRDGNTLGYDDSGFSSVTFDDSAANDVHSYRFSLSGSHNTPIANYGPLTGTWQPDARNISPLSTGAQFDSASRSALLDTFNGMNMSGQWTLFVADLSSGGTATLDSWTLAVTAVPEPRDAALFAAAGLLTFALFRRRLQRKTASVSQVS